MWGMRPPFETEGDGQKSSWIDFSAGAVTLINIFAAHTVLLYLCVFHLGRGATASPWRSNLQVGRLRLHFLLNNYNAVMLIKVFSQNAPFKTHRYSVCFSFFEDLFCAWSLTYIECSHRWQIWLEWGHYQALALSHWTRGHKITATLCFKTAIL